MKERLKLLAPAKPKRAAILAIRSSDSTSRWHAVSRRTSAINSLKLVPISASRRCNQRGLTPSWPAVRCNVVSPRRSDAAIAARTENRDGERVRFMSLSCKAARPPSAPQQRSAVQKHTIESFGRMAMARQNSNENEMPRDRDVEGSNSPRAMSPSPALCGAANKNPISSQVAGGFGYVYPSIVP